MQKRMEFAKGIAKSENVDTLILGAFGFDACEIAEMWQKAFGSTSTIKNAIFAIIDDKRSNNALKSFKDVFNK